MNRLLTRGAALAALMALAAGCGSDSTPTGPKPGPLQVVITSPNADDGAVMFQVTGVLDSVTVPAGLTMYQSVPGPNVIRAIVVGNISSGSNLMTLHVADVAKASSIVTQVMQVAAQGTYEQRPPGAYSLQVQK